MKINAAVLIASLVFAHSAAAQVIELTCTNNNQNWSVDFQINQQQNSVIFAGMKQKDVVINSQIIRFVVATDKGNFTHAISRNTGIMTVQNPDGSLVNERYICERSSQKF